MRTTTFGKLKEDDLFVIVEEPKKRRVLEPYSCADLHRKVKAPDPNMMKQPMHSHERAEGFRPDGRKYYAKCVFSMMGIAEYRESVDDSTIVLKISETAINLLKSFSAYQTQIGPPPLERPEDFFYAGQSVWILKRDSKYVRWLPATIKTVEKVPIYKPDGPYNGPFIHLVEELGISPGANGAIRFDDGDIWPRDEKINP